MKEKVQNQGMREKDNKSVGSNVNCSMQGEVECKVQWCNYKHTGSDSDSDSDTDTMTTILNLPRYTAKFPCQRLSFLLGISTREDGTDTLSRNVGK
jgi:hypothetical protein